MTETLLLATTNRGKIREIRRALKGLPLDIVGMPDVLPGLSYRERGKSFTEIARAKSLFYSRTFDGLTLAEDSGLEVDALGGAPGIRSARFSAPRPSDARNNEKVLRLLRRVPSRGRGARFVCAMALTRRGRVVTEIRGQVRGRIAPGPRGRSGFGYDPLFIYPPLGKTFAEIGPLRKNEVSHRGRALRKLRRFLASYIKDAPAAARERRKEEGAAPPRLT
ncbi:MAG TPA: RdgB/HAM1 family non-canonical purine NTP pyrophosphatase [Acidobacteriota bacterium]|nr:RdgB/HAM1 family non-canonical purine NTP pyrophosphatase [Acidobacteriota bacterium]